MIVGSNPNIDCPIVVTHADRREFGFVQKSLRTVDGFATDQLEFFSAAVAHLQVFGNPADRRRKCSSARVFLPSAIVPPGVTVVSDPNDFVAPWTWAPPPIDQHVPPIPRNFCDEFGRRAGTVAVGNFATTSMRGIGKYGSASLVHDISRIFILVYRLQVRAKVLVRHHFVRTGYLRLFSTRRTRHVSQRYVLRSRHARKNQNR